MKKLKKIKKNVNWIEENTDKIETNTSISNALLFIIAVELFILICKFA